ncbi:MAG: glycosyltransferase family 2 protein [Ilumatobacter sp.]
MKVVLSVITYRRPVGLARLLERLRELDAAAAEITVAVVDNDPERTAASVVEAARVDHPFQLLYANEPQRGITYARDAAVEVAFGERSAEGADGEVCLDGSLDWLGWIDDDEAPRPDWLARLLATHRDTGADVVMGPSVPTFEGTAPAWILDAFESPHFVTGESFPFNYARTSGVIMAAKCMPDERFDHRLALTGGEDRVMFTRVYRAGGSFAWDDDAIVDEWIPASRMSSGWLVRRWFRKGVTRSLAMLILDDPSIARRARRVVGGLGRTVLGAVLTVLALRRGRRAAFAVLPRVFFSIGASYGALGLNYQEYRSTHGS